MRIRGVLAGLVMLLMLFSGFAGLAGTAKIAAAQAEEGILYVAMQQDMRDFNTWNLASNSVWKANVLGWGFEGLFGLDYNLLPYPLLAERFTFWENNLTVRIFLRQGVTFHDGSTVTTDDVNFTYHAARSGTTLTSNIVNAFDANLDGVCSLAEIDAAIKVRSPYVVDFIMPRPYGQFFVSTMGVYVMPRHVWQGHLKADGTYDTGWNDVRATTSTGPFKYKEGVAGSFRVMEKYTGYWGKNFTSPLGYKTYSPYVNQLYFKIYASVDTAILALQGGQVDHIAWAVTPGRVPSLQADPTIGLEFLLDNGYFYLAFNQKKEPMNSLPFRKAVSHVIDKDRIVNVYMGGYGSKGSAVQPPFWEDWYNESVEKYPYDVATASNLLNVSGFTDDNGDGWRELPDGRIMEKLIILTPPADYDPIRIRAGQAIASDLRAIGINAEAKAIDFDTLVARLQGMDYQMLIIGWALSTEPVGNVFDIVGPQASQNTFGFWSDNIPNPYYKDLLGVNTLADAETQAMADKVVELGRLAKGTFNVNEQINYTRWGEGVIADAIPLNPLYYRINIEAYSKTAWTGWIPFTGSIWASGTNYFLLSNLKPIGVTGGVTGATASVNVGLSIPGKVLNGESVSGYVLAIDNQGAPVKDATVTITRAGQGGPATVTVTPTTGLTDSKGLLNITLTGAGLGLTELNVSASKGGVTSTHVTGLIRSADAVPTTLALTIEPEKYVIVPDESIDVDVMVTDEFGLPVQGATVAIDVSQLGYGSVNVDHVVTNATGAGTMIYTAPPTPPTALNTHLPVSLAMNVTKAGYAYSMSPITNIIVKVDSLPDWRIVTVDLVSTTALNATSTSSNMIFMATDSNGVPLADENLTVTYSNESLVSSPERFTMTNVAGMALLTVTMNTSQPESAAVKVTVTNASVANAVAASVTLTCVNNTNPPAAEMYGGYITYNATKYLDPMANLTVTANVWDSAGVPVDGINATLVVSGTPYGSLVFTDAVVYDSTYDGAGINLVTSADGSNVVTSGPMTDYAIYEELGVGPGGVDLTAGEATFEIFGDDVAHVDTVGNIFVVPAGVGFFNDTTVGWQVDGTTTIASDYVIGRSYSMVATAVEISKPVMTWKQTGYDSTTIGLTVTNETGEPVGEKSVYVFQGFFSYPGTTDYSIFPTSYSTYFISRSAAWWGDFIGPSPVVTYPDGTASVSAVSIGAGGIVSSVSVSPYVYARTVAPGSISLLTQAQLVIHPKQAFMTIEPVQSVLEIRKEVVPVKIKATDATGAPIAGLQVRVTPSAGVVLTATGATDPFGEVAILVDTSTISGVRAAYVTIDAKATGNAYDPATALMMVAVKNVGPAITVTNPASAESAAGPNVTVTGSVFDVDGIQLVTLRMDSGTVVTIQGVSGDPVWNIDRLFPNLADGSHTLTVNATDSIGVFTVSTVTFTTATPAPPTAEKKTDWAAWTVAIIGWVVAAIAIVMWMMMRKKAAPTMAPPEPEVPKGETPKL